MGLLRNVKSMSARWPHDDFRPTATWETLRLRAAMLKRIRAFFEERGFLEVETPILSADTVVDRHLDPFAITEDVRTGPGRCPRQLFLQTSPEFAMKRLLAAGAQAIYQITRAFRRGEQGPLHNPEFTMLEWYRVGDGLAQGMQLLSDLAEELFGRGPAILMSYRQAFVAHAGVDPHGATSQELLAAVRAAGIAPPESLSAEDRDGWLDLLLTEKVQAHLGHAQPVIVYDYPATQAALARLRPGNPPLAERFELYVAGVEVANGYHELIDAEELRARMAAANAQRQADSKPTLPTESRLLAAMESGLPECVGVALGVDRAVMLATGATHIAQVMAFPFDRA